MASRRGFLTGLLASGLVPAASWADAGGPAYLSAARRADGAYMLCGISADLQIVFEIPLPDRGHAAAAHPRRPEAVAFARRPGRFALVIDCLSGQERVRLNAPDGRHFYGHGAFSEGGDWLYTTENDYAAAQGRIGIWDVRRGYARAGEFSSGGVGPHDLKRLPGSDVLVVANGGIDTHPDTGRQKLNLPTMRPNLAYIDDGVVVEAAALAPEWHMNSIRHLAVASDGQVAFGMQWQGVGVPGFLAGLHQRGQEVIPLTAPESALHILEGYIGSIAFSGDEQSVLATSPRGGQVHLYDRTHHDLTEVLAIPDACGVAPSASGAVISSGTGMLRTLSGATGPALPVAWDNHLIAL